MYDIPVRRLGRYKGQLLFWRTDPSAYRPACLRAARLSRLRRYYLTQLSFVCVSNSTNPVFKIVFACSGAEASAGGQPWRPEASDFVLSSLKPEWQELRNEERASSGGNGRKKQRDFYVDNKIEHDLEKSMKPLYAFAQQKL